MNSIAPDLQQSLINTFYLTISHNYLPIAYFTGILISLGISLLRPSRFSILVLIGFAILLFGFEYDKHIATGLREQTLNSLATEITHNKFRKLVGIIISDLFPILFYAIGWFSIYIAIIYAGLKISKTKDQRSK